MESLIRYVRDMETSDRQALEHLLGQALRENQQLVIQVINLEKPLASDSTTGEANALPEWCSVYAGLSEEQMQPLEDATLPRANLTRPTE